MSKLTRFLKVFRSRVLERDLDEEVRFHLEERAAANRRKGMAPDEAESTSAQQFGDVARVKSAMREAHMINRRVVGAFAVGVMVGAILTAGVAWRPKPVPITAALPNPAYYRPGQEGTTMPVLVREAKPNYTAEAMRSKIQGTVLMECVVEENGTCGNVRVTRSLEPGLDREAMNALQGWRFEPGKRQGRPVPVIVTIEMAFTLRS
jgi:TonB family protein